LPFKLIVCRSALVEYQRLAEEERAHGSDETLGRVGDEVVRVPRSAGSRERFINDLKEFAAWLTSLAEIRSGIALAALPADKRERLTSFFGQAGAETIALAAAEGIPIWTDDLGVAVIAAGDHGTRRTWTQLVAQRLQAAKVLSEDALADLLMRLITAGYTHTQCSAQALFRAGPHG